MQALLADRGYATAKLTRSVLSGICGWLVRRGAMPSNPVRDLTRLELDRDRCSSSFARGGSGLAGLTGRKRLRSRHDLPELTRFMATGLRLGEALGALGPTFDLTVGTVAVQRTIVRVQGKDLVAKRVKSRASERGLMIPSWCVELLRARRVRLGLFDGPLFPDARGGWRDRSNVGKAFRTVREGSDFDWVKTHTYRKTVATLLDGSGASARMIADQLGHSRISMTQDVYLGRRAANAANLAALESYNTPVANRPTSPATSPSRPTSRVAGRGRLVAVPRDFNGENSRPSPGPASWNNRSGRAMCFNRCMPRSTRFHAVRQACLHQPGRRLGHDHLPTMRSRGDSRSTMHIHTHIFPLMHDGVAGVDSDSRAYHLAGEPPGFR